jgi:HD superfamily phosphodiesterase
MPFIPRRRIPSIEEKKQEEKKTKSKDFEKKVVYLSTERFKVGEKVKTRTNEGNLVEGKFLGTSGNTLAVSLNGQLYHFKHSNVLTDNSSNEETEQPINKSRHKTHRSCIQLTLKATWKTVIVLGRIILRIVSTLLTILKKICRWIAEDE